MASPFELFLPWQFSPTVVLAVILAAALYSRGSSRTRPVRLGGPAERVPAGIAAATYVAALLIWLWPPLIFDVMLGNGRYRLMSWSVLVGALPFWLLVLGRNLEQEEAALTVRRLADHLADHS